MTINFTKRILFTTSCLAISACSSSPSIEPAPSHYDFSSRFQEGSSVSYSGQILRQVLVADVEIYLDELTQRIDQGYSPAPGEVANALAFYFRFDSTVGGQSEIAMTRGMVAMQSVYDDITSGKDLHGKLAGNDSTTDHRDWSTQLQGWDGAVSPTSLLEQWFQQIDELAVARAAGTIPLDPSGAAVQNVYVTASGQDLKELIQKFLHVGVNYAQATDDYLDDDIDGKGLLVGNAVPDDEGKPFTTLEHNWDEAFGYFGAAIDYADYSDDEIVGKGGRDEYQAAHDLNADGTLDLRAEFNFGHSVTAAKRDLGSADAAPTDFTTQIMEAFIAGRHLISTTNGDLAEAELAQLREYRNAIRTGWEQTLAATCVHEINGVLAEMAAFGTADYDFGEHAAVWSELKGYSLGLQFNPDAALSATEFARLQQLIGTAPVLPTASATEIDTYRTNIMEARQMIADAYQFAAENVGDNSGANGW